MYKKYRLFYRKIICEKASPHADARFFARNWTATDITFKGRNILEAEKKAYKYWKQADLGTGKFKLLEEI